MVIAAAIEQAGGDRKAIRDYLASMTDGRAYDGITGKIAFEPTGDVAAKPLVMTRVQRGALVVHEGGRE